jgi:hypothetical protein
MAYRHRDAKFVLNVHGRWNERVDDERCIAWTRALFRDVLQLCNRAEGRGR